jgi:hypothetical protein
MLYITLEHLMADPVTLLINAALLQSKTIPWFVLLEPLNEDSAVEAFIL